MWVFCVRVVRQDILDGETAEEALQRRIDQGKIGKGKTLRRWKTTEEKVLLPLSLVHLRKEMYVWCPSTVIMNSCAVLCTGCDRI